MTNKEIIKALECCKKDDCDNCPNDFGNCCANLAGCSAKTRGCIESLHNIIAEQQAEIKELNTIRSRLIYDSGTLTKISDELYQKIKAEAVKEFAEKLKFVWFDNRYDSPDIDFDYFVDILVETLVGDTE